MKWIGGPFRVLPPSGLLIPGLVTAALIGVIGFELHHGVPADATAPAAPTRQQLKAPSASRLDKIPSDHVARYIETILARPLFSPNRRPETATAETTAPSLPRLTGVVISPAGRSAIFAGSPGRKPDVVGEGEHIGKFIIRSIDVAGVTVVGPEGQRVLHSTFDPNQRPNLMSARPASDSKQQNIPPALIAQFQQALRDTQQHRN